MKQSFDKNFLIVFILILSVFVFLIANTFQLQITKGAEYYNNSLNILVTKKYHQPQRGLILDRNGKVLAENEEVFDLVLNTQNSSTDEISTIAKGLSEGALRSNMSNLINIDLKSSPEFVVLKNLSKNEITEEINSLVKNNNSLELKSRYIRKYNYPNQFTHVIGYTGLASSSDLENGYDSTDFVGKYKLEKDLEDTLKGRKSQQISNNGTLVQQDGIPGDNVYLTIDANWQNKLYELLGNYAQKTGAPSGAAVVIDIESGEVMSLTSYPGFDTNAFVKGISAEDYNSILNDRGQPLLDNTISQSFSPGSIFKLATSYSILKNEIVDANSTVYSNRCMLLGSSQFCEFDKNFYGTLNLEKALIKSSNIYFCDSLLKFAQKKGINTFYPSIEELGITKKTGISLSGEVDGRIDTPESKYKRFNDSWYAGDTCNLSIGQGEVQVTPIQMAQLVAIIDNNGFANKPQLILEKASNISQIDFFNKVELSTNTDTNKSIFETIQKGMSGVAYNYGSAVSPFLINLPNEVRAKTGSAETFEVLNGKVYDRVNGWIIGSFEFKGRRYSFAFFLEYGQGGYYVAPMLKEFLEFINNG